MNPTAILPPHALSQQEQAASEKRIAQAPSTASALATDLNSTLFEMREQTCVKCGGTHIAQFRSLCPTCYEAELDQQVRTGQSKLAFAKTFPDRAKLATRTMHGPSLEKAKEILPILRQPGRGATIILIGDRGAGKTVMATYWAGMLGYGLYTKAFDLFESLKKTFHDDSKVRTHEVLDRYRKAEFLVLDEVQERKESDWENTTLTNLLDKRYDALKPTVLIANLKPEGLDACLGPSIISRVKETGGIIECNWPSYRA